MKRALGCLLLLYIASFRAPAADLPLPPAIQSAFRIAPGLNLIGIDGTGNFYMAGSLVNPGPPVSDKTSLGPLGFEDLWVVKVSSDGQRILYVTEIGSQVNDELGGSAVDAEGQVYLSGRAGTGFPTTEGCFQPFATNGGAFVLKLDSSGKRLIYSTFLGDDLTTRSTAVVIDAAGNAYVGGVTQSMTFPTTTGAYMTSPPPDMVSYYGTLAFVSKLDADGRTLMASTLFGGPEGISSVTGSYGPALALDAVGTIHVVGRARVRGFPTTPNAAHVATPGQEYGGFLARFNNSLAQLLYSTLTGDSSPAAVQVDPEGNSYVAGDTRGLDLEKINASGEIVYEKTYSGSVLDEVQAIRVLNDGSVLLAGDTSSPDFPTRDSVLPCSFNLPQEPLPAGVLPDTGFRTGVFLQLDSAGRIVHSSLLGDLGHTSILAIELGPNGSVYMSEWRYLPGTSGPSPFPGPVLLGESDVSTFVFRFDLSKVTQGQPAPSCLALGATSQPSAVVPGSFATLFGSNLGPLEGAQFQFGDDGRAPTSLAGVGITVGGIPAPILYAQDEQINFLVPQGLRSATTEVCVSNDAGRSCIFGLVAPVHPGIFLFGDGFAVLNEDGTVNTPDNHAPRGGFVSLWGTGMGPYQRALPDGSPADLSLNWLADLPRVLVGVGTIVCVIGCVGLGPGWHAEVQFAGAAPTLLNGVTQVNIRIPTEVPPGARVQTSLKAPQPGFTVGYSDTTSFTIAVK